MSFEENKKVALIILDGWGLSSSWGGNAINMSSPKNFNRMWREYPHQILSAFDKNSSEAGYIGNSEIGHLAISAGRFIEPSLDMINRNLISGEFYKNKAIGQCIEHCKLHNSNLHLVGMISDSGIHSHLDHLIGLLEYAKREDFKNVYIHAITDGKDSDSIEGINHMHKLVSSLEKLGFGEIATVMGRDFAMDKSGNWKNISLAYRAIAMGEGKAGIEPRQVISRSYEAGFNDENIPPHVIYSGKNPISYVRDFDGVIFFNYRSDRMQELAAAFLMKKRLFMRMPRLYNLNVVTFTDYFYDMSKRGYSVAFERETVEPNLSQLISQRGLKQVHIAESEKSSHVTFFFDGGRSEPYSGEDWEIVPSPAVADFRKTPEMSVKAVSERIIRAMKGNKYNFIVANIANVDVLGHTGNIRATSEAVGFVDRALGEIFSVAEKEKVILVITADHGNGERMINDLPTSKDKEINHTLNPVPFIFVDSKLKKEFLGQDKTNAINLSDIINSSSSLSDIAPTILEIFDIEKPSKMTGKSLLNKVN